MKLITFQSNGFCPLQSLFENSGIHGDFNSQSENSLGSVEVHSLTLSYIHGSMKCDSWASFLACAFASPCLGHEPKARVATSETLLSYFLTLCWNFFKKFKLKVNIIEKRWVEFLPPNFNLTWFNTCYKWKLVKKKEDLC
jgi:hypothetical protein